MNLFYLKKEEFGLFLGEEGKGRCLAKCGKEKILEKKQNLVFGVYQAQSVKVWKWAAPMSALVAKALVFFFKHRNEEDWELVFFFFVVKKLPGQTTVDREKHGKLKTRERRERERGSYVISPPTLFKESVSTCHLITNSSKFKSINEGNKKLSPFPV